jgi:putative intracellular protease/amidase
MKEASMNTNGTVLIVGSSSDTLELKGGHKEVTGYYLNELAVPAQAIVDAGYEIVLATPKGGRPMVDQYSVKANYFGDSEAALAKAVDFVASSPSLQNPSSIRSVIEGGLERYIGLFVPGGHPPMMDLMQDPDFGEVLRHFHAEAKPTALLCHGPIAMTAAMPHARAFRQACVDGDMPAARAAAADWQYSGYRVAVFSDDEERWAERNILHGEHVLFYPADALKAAGVEIVAKGLFEPNVVQDRELITGQNPFSDHLLADLFVRTLGRYPRWTAAKGTGRLPPAWASSSRAAPAPRLADGELGAGNVGARR